MRSRLAIPWRAKVAAKLVLSRMPASYALWHRLNLFKHGAMDRPSYALEVFRSHLRLTGQLAIRPNFVGLEMGPGDSLLSAVIAKAYGAGKTWLVDVGPFASDRLAPYQAVASQLRSDGLPAPDLSAARSIAEVLELCASQYGTAGLDSLRAIPSESVDFIWSHAVLEHVRRADFVSTMAESHRILKPGGIASHCVDLRDHLGGKLNNLRFFAAWWEHESIARSGFYTNRIRYSQMLAEFRAAGFEVEIPKLDRWPSLPTPRDRMQPEFQGFDDLDLTVLGFSAVLRKPGKAN